MERERKFMNKKYDFLIVGAGLYGAVLRAVRRP